jgi:hypothetical protein
MSLWGKRDFSTWVSSTQGNLKPAVWKNQIFKMAPYHGLHNYYTILPVAVK